MQNQLCWSKKLFNWKRLQFTKAWSQFLLYLKVDRKFSFLQTCLKWAESTVSFIWSLSLNIQIKIRKDQTTNFLLVLCMDQCIFFQSFHVGFVVASSEKEKKNENLYFWIAHNRKAAEDGYMIKPLQKVLKIIALVSLDKSTEEFQPLVSFYH